MADERMGVSFSEVMRSTFAEPSRCRSRHRDLRLVPCYQSAVEVMALRICVLVAAGFNGFASAAIPAACGAAAEVPKNGANPGVRVFPPSAAEISGFTNVYRRSYQIGGCRG